MSILQSIKSVFTSPSNTTHQETIQLESNQVMHTKNEIHGVKDNQIVVVDVGCRWGFAGRFLSNEYSESFKIFGFDPDQEECSRLQKSYQNLTDGFVTCIPLGLAGASGERILHITKEPACSSLHEPIQFLSENYPALDCISPQKTVTVNVKTLKQWAAEQGVDRFDYIKIDTQGSELEILRGAEDILCSTRCIDIEVEFNPIYEGQTLFGETDTYLRSKGFSLWRLSNMVHYSLGGESLPLKEPNTICFDNNHRLEVQSYGGQLFWADAKYIHNDVLKNCHTEFKQTQRDIVLFTTLGMHDIVDHIKRTTNLK